MNWPQVAIFGTAAGAGTLYAQKQQEKTTPTSIIDEIQHSRGTTLLAALIGAAAEVGLQRRRRRQNAQEDAAQADAIDERRHVVPTPHGRRRLPRRD